MRALVKRIEVFRSQMRESIVMIRKVLIAAAFLAAAESTSHAYELGTHGALTYEAYKRSVLTDGDLLKQLGIKNGANPFGTIYYDMSGAETRERTRQPFEEDQTARRMPFGTEPLSIEGWLLRGAIREDDLGEILGVRIGGDPHDDPYGNIFRVFNHFYDPVFDRPLTVPGHDTRTAPAWALGTTNANAFTQPNIPESGRRNHFTIFDAREAMYRALTGRNQAGDVVAATKELRNRYWATIFRALGDVVHLIQDMAQPQHTRNDAHSGVPGGGHASIFEAYIECRATGGLVVSVLNPASAAGTQQRHCTPLAYDNGYPLPRFTNYSDFFSTRGGINGRGLADYSNRGFFSAGTNFGSSEARQYPSPPNNPSAYQKEQVALATVDEGYQTILAPLHILKGGVQDTLPGGQSATGVPLTTEGMWYQPLADFSTPANAEAHGYTLTRPNYDAQANLLIPRAVAYSAGLINYFFRGKIDLDLATGPSQYVIKNYSDENMQGTFALYYDAADGTRHLVPGTGPGTAWENVSIAAKSPNGPGRSQTFTVLTPTDPAPAEPGKYMLVFRGRLGQETDAVIGRVISEYLYVLDGDGLVTRVSIYGGPTVDYGIPLPSFNYIPAGLSVYDAVLYYSTNYRFTRNRPPSVAMQYRLHDLTSTAITQTTGLGNGIATNSDRVYVTDVGGADGNGPAQVWTFSHDGTPIGSFVSSPDYGGASVDAAANETHMLTTEGGRMFIFTRDGSPTATISDLSWFSSEAAMNSDFAYTVDGPNIGIYSLTGMLRQYVDLGSISGFDIEAIDVTDDRLYVVTTDNYRIPEYTLHVYERQVERDAAGNVTTERFNLQRSIPFSLSARWYPLQICADRAQLSRQPTH